MRILLDKINFVCYTIIRGLVMKEDDTCVCCDGTGGSVGNENPDDDWVCDCCNGSGKNNRGPINPPDPDPIGV